MTELLHRAFLLASMKSEEEQNALALVLLDGLEDDLPPTFADAAPRPRAVHEGREGPRRRG